MCLGQKSAWRMIQFFVRGCRVGADNRCHLLGVQVVSHVFQFATSRGPKTDSELKQYILKNITVPRNRQWGSWARRWAPSVQQQYATVGHRRDERRWIDMLDPNLMGAESGDPTFMWCASLVTQQRRPYHTRSTVKRV
jgi:hypothetical protein